MKYEVVVVGGGPGGIIAAVTARKVYGPELGIALIRPEPKTLVPCGIPYMFGTLGGVDQNLMPDKPLEAGRIDTLTDEVVALDLERRVVATRSGGGVAFDRLVLATGSEPIVPAALPGTDLDGVFAIRKSYSYLNDLCSRLVGCNDVVIIGGGFIGVELADELAKRGGRNVTVVEMAGQCLWQSFDPEFCMMGEQALVARGVQVLTGTRVKAISGNGRVQGVETEGGRVKADAVILAIGARPSGALAAAAGLRMTPRGAVAVDAAMRTSHPDVFAVGDCASKVDFFSGSESAIMLASVATIEARTAGANLYGVRALLPGGATPGAFSTAVGELALSSTGLTETEARRRGLEVTVGVGESVDRHPGSLPGARPVKVKLVFGSLSGQLLGGQASGGTSVGELVNVIALAVGHRMAAEDLHLMPMGTHPLLTPAPTTYPIVGAAWDYLLKARRT